MKIIRHSCCVLLFAMSCLWAQNYPYVISSLAGVNPLGDGGPAIQALLEFPTVVGVDNGSGAVYINDTINGKLRAISANGIISTFLPGTVQDFKIDAAGNLYAVDGNYTAFKVTRAGTVSVIAGAGVGLTGDGVPATQSRFNGLSGIAVDAAGNVFISDTFNGLVRKISATDGTVKTVAGNGLLGYSGDGNNATLARLAYPQALAVDSNGNLYIAEAYDIRKVSPNGVISTIAGNGSSLVDGALAINAPISFTVGIAVDSAGVLYIADPAFNRVRTITGNTIRTIAGVDTFGSSGDGGPATRAELDNPTAVAVDSGGNIYISDEFNLRIRKISSTGIISTIAGRSHYAGDNGSATDALLHLPTHAISDSAGNIYIADNDNHRIRKITPAGVITTIAGAGRCAYSGDGGPAITANICYPSQMAFDAAGSLYFTDSGNYVVRRVSPTGGISTVAGKGTSGDTGDGGPAISAQFKYPVGLAIDNQGNIYVSDLSSYKVRKFTLNGNISTVAGTGSKGFSGDGATGASAQLSNPGFLALDSAGNLFISDEGNLRIRRLSNGIIQTVAGISTCCYVAGKGAQTYIGTPGGIAVDAAGNLFIAMRSLNRIGKLTPAGDFSIIAGNNSFGALGDGGLATNAFLFSPRSLFLDSAGDMIVADTFNSRIRKLTLNSPSKLAVAGGDSQSGTIGSGLPIPLTVQVSFRAGVATSGIPVSFAVTTGSATLSSATANTDPAGVAGVGVTLGSNPGPVTITASIAGIPSVQFHVNAVAGVPVPAISAGGVVGAGASVPAVARISPGGFATIYGSLFAPEGTFRAVQGSDFVNGSLPTKLAGVCVQFGSALGFITLVTPGQINVQVPDIPVDSNIPVQVVTNCGESAELKTAAVSVAAGAATPEFLYWVKNADGKNPVIAVNAVTGAYAGASGLIPGLTLVPAKSGDYLIVYGISFGATNPAVPAGLPATDLSRTTAAPVITLGGTTLPDANILYVGLSPGTAGLYQVNIQIPANLPDGDYPFVLSLGSASTPVGGYITVKN